MAAKNTSNKNDFLENSTYYGYIHGSYIQFIKDNHFEIICANFSHFFHVLEKNNVWERC